MGLRPLVGRWGGRGRPPRSPSPWIGKEGSSAHQQQEQRRSPTPAGMVPSTSHRHASLSVSNTVRGGSQAPCGPRTPATPVRTNATPGGSRRAIGMEYTRWSALPATSTPETGARSSVAPPRKFLDHGRRIGHRPRKVSSQLRSGNVLLGSDDQAAEDDDLRRLTRVR